MSLRLDVTARHWQEAQHPGQYRDVYLHQIDGGIMSPFMYHTECPIGRVREIIAWAESVAIPVEYIPAGNLAAGWAFPSEVPAPIPVPDPSF